jgi:pyruvate,orthophosphate dikinase
MTKSTQSDIRALLDLYQRKKIDLPYLVNAIKPEQLNEILHPIIDQNSVKNLKGLPGGIAGAPGAAIGRVYFSTEALLDAYKSALQKGEDTRMILCMPSTFAEDVKAIEVATGVLSSEGGYSAHASVVARQYGKVSLVNKDLAIEEKKAKLDTTTIKEGDLITLEVPHYGDPVIYLGEAKLIEPDPEESGLISFVETVKKGIDGFGVRVNADNPGDAGLAVKFGADGIGLCRTEHMFFKEERINEFRKMIVSSNTEERKKVLNTLKKMQLDDFHKIFKAMDGKEVTIRLLDAPLHEFLPHNEKQFKAFIDYLKKNSDETVNENEIRRFSDSLNEFNPMLGHRGCRIAVSYPEIYEMQVEAIFEAAYKARKEGADVRPEIMIPLIMNASELKLIIHGKRIEGQTYRGLSTIENDVREKLKEKKPVDYKFGTMIELPVAALAAGEISRYAEFFSFGTNDLTQTTIGLSRDDYTSFMPDYTLFDILHGNPFQLLEDQVKELISTAVRRGKMTRPDLHTGLCGEHGAIPQNIAYCMDAGLDYVSCSLYSVPIALLAVAQQQMPQEEEG